MINFTEKAINFLKERINYTESKQWASQINNNEFDETLQQGKILAYRDTMEYIKNNV